MAQHSLPPIPPADDLSWRVAIVGDLFVDYLPPRLTASLVRNDWLTVFVFGATDAGVVDLIGFHLEPAGPDEKAGERVNTLGLVTQPAMGLTSRQLRTAANYGGLITRARNELAELARADSDTLGRHPHDASAFVGYVARRLVRESGATAGARHSGEARRRQLAELVIRYDAVRLSGVPRARAVVASDLGRTESAVKEQLRAARLEGLWATTGPGKPGAPTQAAYELASQQEDER